MPNCERENVNEGEENALFKAFHCSLLRCPGVGQCADPLLCSPALFPGKNGRHKFRPSWQARHNEIITLAMRGQQKKRQARRLETLHDTTLCKVLQSTASIAADNSSVSAQTRLATKLLQIDLQRLFRQTMRTLRETASAAASCIYGYPERMIHSILLFVGVSYREDSVCLRGLPMWHDEQLHLAEWQALQQLEFLFNVTLGVDAKNMAIDKLNAHKKSGHVSAETFESLRNPMHTIEGEDLGEVADEEIAMEPDEPQATYADLPPITDPRVLLRLLGREEEVALARTRGKGRREDLQNMKEIFHVFGSPQHPQAKGLDPSHFGAAEHERRAAVARHRECFEALKAQQVDNLETTQAQQIPEDASAAPDHADVELMHEADTDTETMGPIDFAKWLSKRGELTLEQRGPVALIARDMQKAYDDEMKRRENLPASAVKASAGGAAEHALLPRKGRVARLLLYGGGGCGKTRIINKVLAPLFRKSYGSHGVILTAFANKPARLIKGKTSHSLIKLRGAQSLTMPRLRIQNDQERKGLAAVWAPAGALVKDEFTQQPGMLEHALAVRAMYGREQAHDLCRADYASPKTNYASIPWVVTAGDPLQFPPVPSTASLLAEPEGQTKEHRAAQMMFEDQDYVCQLKTTMRFRYDPVLSEILRKMRSPEEDRSELQLTDEEWRVLQSTDLAQGASLEGTEMWYHAAFAWTHVCMAQWIRSVHSAAHHQETLFMLPARDYIKNVEARDLQAVRDELLKVPNMNSMGRLPGVALLHVRMKVRITATVCPCQAPVDTVGVVKSIELSPLDRARWQQQPAETMFLLHEAPTVLFEIDDNTTDTGLGPGVVAVDACKSMTLSHTVSMGTDSARCSRARTLAVRFVREQLPLTILTASTLYTLQGTTATPGLIYHCKTPRRLSKQMKWIAIYMALSRVESLATFRSIGMSDGIRAIIDEGPPPGLLTRFLAIFQQKADETEKLMENLLREFGWDW